MTTSSIELIRETAENQRRRRNVTAMHTVADASPVRVTEIDAETMRAWSNPTFRTEES